MSAVAVVGAPRSLRRESSPPRRQTSPATSAELDLSAEVVRLTSLGITIQCASAAPTAADWSEPDRTLTLRADLPVAVAVSVLRDLWALHTDAGHVSWSIPTPHLRAVGPGDTLGSRR